MAGQLLGLLDDMSNQGMYKGLTNFIGNSTNFGQTLNGVGNIFQNTFGEPQHNLIGQTPQQQAAVPTPQQSPPSMQDAIKAHIQQQTLQPSIGNSTPSNSNLVPPLATQGQQQANPLLDIQHPGSAYTPGAAGNAVSEAGKAIGLAKKGIGLIGSLF